MTATAADTMTVASKLVDLCREGKHLEAVQKLYADDVVSIEAFEMPGHEKRLEGKDAVLGKSQWFFDTFEVLGGDIKGPYPFDDGRFTVWMSMDISPKEGPEAGQQTHMEEIGLYRVRDGKISQEEFFYANQG